MLTEDQLEQYLAAFSAKKDFTLKLLSMEYSLTDKQISKGADCLDWAELSKNTSIDWSVELIRQHKDRWVWPRLSANNSIRWTAEMLREFADKLTWGKGKGVNTLDDCRGISYNTNVAWTAELIAEFKDYLDFPAISENEGIPWTADLIAEFKDDLDFPAISGIEGIPWTADLIRTYSVSDSFFWYCLSLNQGVPWTYELIEEFRDKLYFKGESSHDLWEKTFGNNPAVRWDIPTLELVHNQVDWSQVCYRKDIEWSFEYLKKFADLLDWSRLCANESFPWDLRLMKRYAERVDLVGLCKNPSIVWNAPKIKWLLEQTREKHTYWVDRTCEQCEQSAMQVYTAFCANTKVKWNKELIHALLVELKPKPASYVKNDEEYLKALSSNPSLPFTDALIERYQDYWDWLALTANKGLNWSLKRVSKFEDQLDWAVISGGVESIDYSIDFIDRYADKLIWSSGDGSADLSSNPYLPWSSDFIEYYKKQIKWGGGYTERGHWGTIKYSILEAKDIRWAFSDLVKYYKKLHFDLGIKSINCDDWDYDYMEQHPDMFPDEVFTDNALFFKDAGTVIRFHDRLPKSGWAFPDWLKALYLKAIETVGVNTVLEHLK